jgi:hypothetical protein
MIFAGKRLSDVREEDIRQLVNSGLEEHPYLEYKQELYPNNHEGGREFLQDICMFANAEGGLLLIGVPERRDANDQPTGTPDPDGVLGVAIENSQAQLQAYDARVVSCIQDRLPLESSSVRLANGRYVLLIRVPNGLTKPYRVWYQGHAYFPSRRERHRYEMDVREIKELAMRLASQLERAEELLRSGLFGHLPGNGAVLLVGLAPIFFGNFLINIADLELVQRFGAFDVNYGYPPQYVHPTHTFDGLERASPNGRTLACLARSGLIIFRARNGDDNAFDPRLGDVLLRQFVIRAQNLLAIDDVSPALISMAVRVGRLLQVVYGGAGERAVLQPRDYFFPALQVETLEGPPETFIRPLCDHLHQMFGIPSSPCFDEDGTWNPPPFAPRG